MPSGRFCGHPSRCGLQGPAVFFSADFDLPPQRPARAPAVMPGEERCCDGAAKRWNAIWVEEPQIGLLAGVRVQSGYWTERRAPLAGRLVFGCALPERRFPD